jgi:hypothetical protein
MCCLALRVRIMQLIHTRCLRSCCPNHGCYLRAGVAGTGGSLLVIGSAAGVAYMGLEGVGFGWYLRRVTPWVLAGYAAANATYIALHGLPQALVY